jgi:hypothetical protein
MTAKTIEQPTNLTLPARQRWEAPAIILERSLQVSAQDGPPNPVGGPPNGFLGPLGTSGDTGNCGTF